MMANTKGHAEAINLLFLTYRYKGNWFMNDFYEYMNPKSFYQLTPLLTSEAQEKQDIERLKMRLAEAKANLPSFDLNQIYSLDLKKYLKNKMKLGCSMAYIYAYYSQNPNNDELFSYSLKDFQARLFENEFYLFPDKSSCHISDVLTEADHLKIARARRVKCLKKIAKRATDFSRVFLKKVIAHAL